MIKDKLDFKLINIAIIALIIYLMYHTGNLWIGIVAKFAKIVFPFFLAFVVAYALYPFLKYLTDKKIPKALAIGIILCVILGFLAILVILVTPLLFDQIISLLNSLITFIKEFSISSDIEFGTLQETLTSTFNNIIVNVGKYATDGVTKVINVSMDYIATAVIAFSAAIYLLIDMEEIRSKTKKYLRKKSKRAYQYVHILDVEMKSYLSGIIKVMGITVIEYSVAYTLIGHPDAVLLGVLAMVGGLIPYFGGMMTNVVAAVTAFVISPALFVKTVITFVILSSVDGYVINPLVYGKTNNVHPLIVIMSVFIGGKLLGVFGIMVSFPAAVIIISTIKFFKEDISDKIEDMKKKEA
jgi:predicted PurR-regulated permease PerM